MQSNWTSQIACKLCPCWSNVPASRTQPTTAQTAFSIASSLHDTESDPHCGCLVLACKTMLTDDNLVWFPDPSLQCSSASSAEGPENILLQIIFKLIAGSRGITGGLEDSVCLPHNESHSNTRKLHAGRSFRCSRHQNLRRPAPVHVRSGSQKSPALACPRTTLNASSLQLLT